jgi:hypothetical protein
MHEPTRIQLSGRTCRAAPSRSCRRRMVVGTPEAAYIVSKRLRGGRPPVRCRQEESSPMVVTCRHRRRFRGISIRTTLLYSGGIPEPSIRQRLRHIVIPAAAAASQRTAGARPASASRLNRRVPQGGPASYRPLQGALAPRTWRTSSSLTRSSATASVQLPLCWERIQWPGVSARRLADGRRV